MSKHDDLLNQGPREAPEPETAEQKSQKLGLKTAGGGVAAGGIGLAKAGILSKFLLWIFVWNGVSTGLRIGGWIGIAIIAAVVGGFIWYRRRHQPA
ncbi:MAG TPA: hypothetical protein VM690_07585 [Gaiellaceae bacterium]|nr:hypothetical protein [Gaiellaceae bacterium]